MTFSTLASPGVSLQGGGGSGGGGGTPGGSDTQIQYNSSGTFAGASGLTTNGTELTIASGTKTADAPVLNMSQTWNNGAVTFTGLKFNAATGSSAGSAAASLLMDLQLEGTSRLAFSKNSSISHQNSALTFGVTGVQLTTYADGIGVDTSANVRIGSGRPLAWSALGGPLNGVIDLFLTRRAAANLRLGAADAAGSAISISSVASNQLTLASSHGLTSGAAVIITGTTAPSGTSLNTLYYARSISAAVIELYLTFDAATATSGTTGIVAVTTAGTSASIRLSTPFQRLSPQDFTGTDIPGQPLLINGSRGTGTGAGGSIIFQVAPAGSSGTAQNALSDALTIDSSRITTAIALKVAESSGRIYLGGNGGGTGTNLYANGGTSIFFTFNGSQTVSLNSTGPQVYNSGSFSWSSVATGNGTPDVLLYRDAANTLALRNGTNAQAFNVYGTYTDGSNYERLAFVSGAAFEIQAQAAGSGSGKSIQIKGGSGAGFFFGGGGAVQWQVNSSGNLLAQTDNAVDIGASGANRPRNVYVAFLLRSAYIETNSSAPAGNGGIAIGQSVINSNASGVISLSNYTAGNDFNRLQFGGTSASFPALKRSSASLIVRLADDTANAALESASLKTDAPAGGTAATWKLGVRVAATTLLDTTQYIEVDVGGTLYKLAVVTT